jgi:hypothetical protein
MISNYSLLQYGQSKKHINIHNLNNTIMAKRELKVVATAEGNTVRRTVRLGSTKQALIISEEEFDEDGFSTGNVITGMLPINTDVNDPVEMLEKAKEKIDQWEFTGEPDLRGFYRVVKVGKDVVLPTNSPTSNPISKEITHN